jgi:hypothetical protein
VAQHGEHAEIGQVSLQQAVVAGDAAQQIHGDDGFGRVVAVVVGGFGVLARIGFERVGDGVGDLGKRWVRAAPACQRSGRFLTRALKPAFELSEVGQSALRAWCGLGPGHHSEPD